MSGTATDATLRVRGLQVGYVNGPRAVRGADLDVHSGRVVALVGPNGAGKTSLLNAIAGRERRSPLYVAGGSVRLDGKELLGTQVEKVAKAGVVLIPDRGKVFNDMPVHEHLQLGLARLPRARRNEVRERVLDVFPSVSGWLDRIGGALSGGERQMVATAVALCSDPSVLMIDEMSQGLSPAAVEVVGAAVGSVRELGVAVLLVEQTHAVAARFADDVFDFERGTCSPLSPTGGS